MEKMRWFNEQKDANISEFLFGCEYIKRRNALKKLSNALTGLEWSLSCSANLFFRGIVDDFNDFDIIISKKSLKKAIEKLKSAGAVEYSNSNQYKSCFASKYYEHWQIDDIDFDLIMDFTILVPNSKYVYKYTKMMQDEIKINGFEKIQLVPIEFQYIFYRMMEVYTPIRRMKRELVEKYMLSGGSTRFNALKSEFQYMINDYGIPSAVKQDIADIIAAIG